MACQSVLAGEVVPAPRTASIALVVKVIQRLNGDCAPVLVPRKAVFVPIRNLLWKM